MLLSKRSDLFFFSSVHKKDQKKSPGVFKTECSSKKRTGSDTDKIREKAKLTRGSKH